jgi:dihydropyrimidinase
MSKIIIRNGQVIQPHRTYIADVLIDGETIAGITAPGAVTWSDAREIDASDCLVMPGVVDAHTHIQLDTGVFKTDDTWEIGTKSAAFGGVTTVVDFATQFQGMSFRAALDARLAECQPAVIDYGLHMMVTDLARDPDQAYDDLCELREMGVPSIKLYTTYRPNYFADDATILHTLRALPGDMLAMFHCENDAIVGDASARLVEAGDIGWRFHGEARPPEAETEAAIRVMSLAEIAEANIYIVHCSAAETAHQIAQLRPLMSTGHSVLFETCIQYLTLDESAYDGEQPYHYILQPPLRGAENFAPLFSFIEDGSIAVLSTDHCDYSLTQKMEKDDFRTTPGGLPGLETLLPLSYSLFRKHHPFRDMLSHMVDVLCTNPARIFGLYPKKGIIQPGSDADIVIYDPQPETVISQNNLHTIGGYTPYEGMSVMGRVRATISRGEVIVDEGEFVGQVGRGQFLEGKPFKPMEPHT